MENYRLTIYPAFERGNRKKIFHFDTAKEMIAAKDTAADLLLFLQDEIKVMDDYSNMFIQEENVDGDWYEMEDGL